MVGAFILDANSSDTDARSISAWRSAYRAHESPSRIAARASSRV
jgi:hypothetical protein